MKVPSAILTGLIFLTVACGSDEKAAPSAKRDAGFEAGAPKLMERAQVPGMAVAVVRDGKVSSWSSGYANTDSGETITGSTIFEAASLGKPVFAMLVMTLVEEGVIELDQSLASYMPQPYFADPRARNVTPRMVLSHRSGLPNWRPRGEPLALLYDPDSRFSYSGEGYVYLQKAIETATGESLEQLASRLVFKPLGMSATSFTWKEEYDATKAFGHDETGRVQDRRKPGQALAAATLHTTATDLGRFLLGMFERTTISEESVHAMLSTASTVPSNCAVCNPSVDPGPDSEDLSWGLGYGLLENPSHRYFWHWGDNGDFKAYLFGDDANDTGVAILTNGSGGLAIAGDIAAEALGDQAPLRPLEWLSYERWDSPRKVALHEILTSGEDRFPTLDDSALDEKALNSLGYSLLRADRYNAAKHVFRLATERHPESSNAWDSFGESLAMSGRRADAIEAYEKSLDLAPDSRNGKLMLERLQSGLPLSKDVLPTVAGTYDLGDDLVVISIAGEGLVANGSTMKDVPLIAIRSDRFIAGDQNVAFAIDEERGTIMRIQNGRVTHGRKR
ncbi:MAG: serine hydrolase [Acidobacteria bacterium]|nr:serine hydrolase [Acidobacteriota bacterium]